MPGIDEALRGSLAVIRGKSWEELEKEQIRSWERISIKEHMEQYEKQGMDRKSAMKAVARDRGMGKREVYQYLLNGRG